MVRITKQELEQARAKYRKTQQEIEQKKRERKKREEKLFALPPMERLALDDPKEYTRRITRRKVARGEVAKYPCVICGDPDVEGHHPDYNRPDYVVWLCKYHHSLHHLYECERTGENGIVFARYLKAHPRPLLNLDKLIEKWSKH